MQQSLLIPLIRLIPKYVLLSGASGASGDEQTHARTGYEPPTYDVNVLTST